MRNLIEFFTRHSHWLLFLLLEVVSLSLLFHFNSYQGSVWFTSANTVVGKVYEARSEVDSYFGLADINRQLTERNIYLEQQVNQLSSQLKAKNPTGDSLLRAVLPADNYKLIPAKVIDNSISKPDNFITINKGSADGVKKDMGVACGTGVVGIVYIVSSHYSVVLPVLNTKSNISCAIQGRDYFGYLHWNGGPSNLAYVDDIPRHAHFKLYEKVVTSGYSSVFPPGILVGKILHVYNSVDGLSYRLQVQLSTDFARLRDVCVIDDASARERLQMMQAAEDSLKLRE
jgi:rod shape-determining protein MreC